MDLLENKNEMSRAEWALGGLFFSLWACFQFYYEFILRVPYVWFPINHHWWAPGIIMMDLPIVLALVGFREATRRTPSDQNKLDPLDIAIVLIFIALPIIAFIL